MSGRPADNGAGEMLIPCDEVKPGVGIIWLLTPIPMLDATRPFCDKRRPPPIAACWEEPKEFIPAEPGVGIMLVPDTPTNMLLLACPGVGIMLLMLVPGAGIIVPLP